MKNNEKKPSYGNWVGVGLLRKCVLMLLCFAIIDAALWIFLQGVLFVKIVLALPPLILLTCVIYLLIARRLFSDDGGDIQNKVVDILMGHIDWDGKGRVLDIGCGSGRLAVRLAKKFPDAVVTGVDYWGGSWSYQKQQCEENAALEDVGERTAFLQASASKLPFEDGAFDLVVSNLTFHEVRDSKNKLDVLREALRVVKKGGVFVYQDLFLLKSTYGTTEDLTAAVSSMGTANVRFIDTSASPFIPRALKLPFMLGALGLISGEKV
jgi:SAM-dependent methyltransferase